MKRSWRNIVVAACALAAVIGLAALGSRLSVDAGAYRQRFETVASDPLGLRVSVRGPFRVRFAGNILLVMRDVHVLNSRGDEVLSADRATIAVAPLPLLFNQCWVRRIAIERPRISFERGRDGVLNWARRAEPRGALPILARAKLSLMEGSVHYADATSGAVLDAADVNAEVGDLRKERGEGRNLIAAHSFRAKLECRTIRTKTVSIDDVSVAASVEHGAVEVDPLAMRVFGGKGLVKLQADLSDSLPRYRLRGTLSQFRLDQCLRTLSPDSIATGTMNFAVNVSLSGRAPADWSRSIAGDVVLRGQEIELRGHDLDHDVSRMQPNQLLDLAGVGSVFFVGPLGIAVTKGFDFTRLLRPSNGNTLIPIMISSWDVRDGELRATDVAMATSKNRLAMRGNLDFVHQRFDSVTVALIDKDGCAKIRQELRGTFQKPELTKPTILSTLIGPARTVYTRVKGLLPSGPCTVFYSGSVPPPE